MADRAEITIAASEPATVLRGLVDLTKPAITRMVLVTAAFGALAAPGRPSLGRLTLTLLATGAVVAAANALNMYLERDVDALMTRTSKRPLPSGRVSPELALAFGVSLAIFGISALAIGVNAMSSLLCALAFLSYVLVYTPLKRVTPLALPIGAVPGAVPPLIGWVSVTGTPSLAGLSLFAILFVWQLPHFLAIATFRRSEYERAGFAVHSVVHGGSSTARAVIGYLVLLLATGFVPLACGLGDLAYAIVSGTYGGGLLVAAIVASRTAPLERWARHVFVLSLPYPLVALGLLALVSP